MEVGEGPLANGRGFVSFRAAAVRDCGEIVWASQETRPTRAEVFALPCGVRLLSCPCGKSERFFPRAMSARKPTAKEDRSVEDAAQEGVDMIVDAARVGACATLIPERAFIAFGGPQGHGDSLTFKAPMRAPNVREGLCEGTQPRGHSTHPVRERP